MSSSTETSAPVEATPHPAVSLLGLTKRFGQQVAVAGVSLDIPTGSFLGLVGPNGAGKSTALSMITGLLRPDSGTALLHGVDIWQDPTEVRRRIGVVPEDLRLFERLSGQEILEYNGRLREIPLKTTRARGEELLAVLGLQDAARKLVVDYSSGMRKKIALACALIHSPSVLFLDEPFESVDPVSARTMREVLNRLTETGATIIFSSHVMELVERLCDRVAILNHGHLIAEGTTEAVCSGLTLEDRFAQLVGVTELGSSSLAWLHGGEESPPPSSVAPTESAANMPPPPSGGEPVPPPPPPPSA